MRTPTSLVEPAGRRGRFGRTERRPQPRRLTLTLTFTPNLTVVLVLVLVLVTERTLG
ncbi:MAG: hypothetical protein ACRCZP_15280 [Phycicoccus sp.]